jgi:hypothetical protein
MGQNTACAFDADDCSKGQCACTLLALAKAICLRNTAAALEYGVLWKLLRVTGLTVLDQALMLVSARAHQLGFGSFAHASLRETLHNPPDQTHNMLSMYHVYHDLNQIHAMLR